MKKNARTLIILGIVLVVIIGAYIGVSVYNSAQAQKKADETKATQLWSNGREAPVSISYTAGDKTMSFKQADGHWAAADNKDLPLDQTLLSSLASALQGLTAVRTIDTGAPLSTYGLDKPAYTVTASDDKGKSLTLLIGAANGSNYYAMAKDGNKIYTVASTFVTDLKPDYLGYLLLDKLQTLSSTNVNTITLGTGKASLTLDRHQNKDNSYTWFIVKGDSYTAADDFKLPAGSDKSAGKLIDGAVSALGSATFSSCAAYKPAGDDLKKFGLDTPQLTVKVDWAETTSPNTLDQKSTTGTVNLEIGAKLADGSGWYARVPGSAQVNVLPDSAVTPLMDALTAMGSAS